MADVSQIKAPDNNVYNIKDNLAVMNITYNNDIFTATRRNGTTFTFTIQDLMLLEDGNFILTEDGDFIILEAEYLTSADFNELLLLYQNQESLIYELQEQIRELRRQGITITEGAITLG